MAYFRAIATRESEASHELKTPKTEHEGTTSMSRSEAVTFKGTPLTLAGDAVAVGAPGPDFSLTYFED